MIRAIVKPAGKTFTLNLPDDLIGKTVEVIAFEIEKNDLSDNPIVSENSKDEIKQRYLKYPRISHEGYQFDRDDAHDHE